MKRLLSFLILSALITGCARHVVVKPEEVGRLNSPDWILQSEPKPIRRAE